MTFEWDAKKSAGNKLKHGVSFEWVEDSIHKNGVIDLFEKITYPGQETLVFRGLDGKIYEAATETRGASMRLISAHRSRKMEKKYGP